MPLSHDAGLLTTVCTAGIYHSACTDVSVWTPSERERVVQLMPIYRPVWRYFVHLWAYDDTVPLPDPRSIVLRGRYASASEWLINANRTVCLSIVSILLVDCTRYSGFQVSTEYRIELRTVLLKHVIIEVLWLWQPAKLLGRNPNW